MSEFAAAFVYFDVLYIFPGQAVSEICLGCLLMSDWEKIMADSAGYYVGRIMHPIWPQGHLWIPQEDLEHAARKREVRMPLS